MSEKSLRMFQTVCTTCVISGSIALGLITISTLVWVIYAQ